MRKPIDPRSRKKPEKVHTKDARLTLRELIKTEDEEGEDVYKVSLQTVIGAWNKAVKDHESQGHRITEGPSFANSLYGSELTLAYTYEWDNLTYEQEKAAWDEAIAKYERELAEWNAFEEERKKGLAMNVKNIDLQIVRAEHRLANLQAVKARKPIPYPEG